MSEDRLEIIKENVYMRSEIAKISRLGIDTSLREELELLKEIERLNNIINGLEKELQQGSFDVYFCSTNTQKTFKSNEIIIKSLILDKLNKLKNGDNDV